MWRENGDDFCWWLSCLQLEVWWFGMKNQAKTYRFECLYWLFMDWSSEAEVHMDNWKFQQKFYGFQITILFYILINSHIITVSEFLNSKGTKFQNEASLSISMIRWLVTNALMVLCFTLIQPFFRESLEATPRLQTKIPTSFFLLIPLLLD